VIDWFNVGLFDDASVLTLEADEIKALTELARLDWLAIEPSIFGTLFERDPSPPSRWFGSKIFCDHRALSDCRDQ